jgi:hypothetical protein
MTRLDFQPFCIGWFGDLDAELKGEVSLAGLYYFIEPASTQLHLFGKRNTLFSLCVSPAIEPG